LLHFKIGLRPRSPLIDAYRSASPQHTQQNSGVCARKLTSHPWSAIDTISSKVLCMTPISVMTSFNNPGNYIIQQSNKFYLRVYRPEDGKICPICITALFSMYTGHANKFSEHCQYLSILYYCPFKRKELRLAIMKQSLQSSKHSNFCLLF
jgi:hypothetical protein